MADLRAGAAAVERTESDGRGGRRRPWTPGAFRPDSAMILAAGLGLRMRPLTSDRPKPLLEVGGRTLLDWTLDRFAAFGVAQTVVNLHYKGEMIERHLAGRGDAGIVFSREAERLESGGGIVRALPLLGARPFWVANADTIWLDGPRPALERLAAAWDAGRMDALLMLMSVPRTEHYDGPGDFMMDPAGRLTWRPERRIAPYVYAGLNIAHPRLFADAPEGPFRLTKLWRRAEAAGRLYGLVHDGAWFHVGTPEALKAADHWLDPRNARWLEP
jgi:MurNAc alpha-1-phosphate uridylyltransferase